MPQKVIRNLQFGIGFSLFILIASSIASYFSIQKQMEHREDVSQSRKSITAVKDVLNALLDAETGNRGFQLSGQKSFLEPYTRSVKEYEKAIDFVKSLNINDDQQRNRLRDLEQNVDGNMANLKQFVQNKNNGIAMTQDQMMLSKIYMDKCRIIVHNYVKYEENQLAKKSADLTKTSNLTVLFIIFSALAATGVTLFFYVRLRNDLLRRDRLEKELKAKDLEISNRVAIIQQVASRVSKGDYEVKIADTYEGDLGDLVDSLSHMTEALKTSFDKINKSDWRQKGLAVMNETLVGNKAVHQVATDALTKLINYSNSTNGAIYLEENGQLKLEASYGLEKNMKSSFALGEGMVGQVYIEKEMKVLNDLDDDQFVISFATGKIKTNSIVLIPIVLDHQCVGVLELSSASNADQNLLEYFEESCRNLAIALDAAKGREKLQKLLEETQAQSEELQVQHSELENLNAELEAQTQKLQASEEELRVQQEELMQINTELEERSKLLEEKNHQIAERNSEIQQKAEELELSTKYKSEFLANMSHELRTPLNSILLLSKLMAENADGNMNEDQIESSKVIQSSGTSLLSLIDEILDLAKIESGKMSLEYEEIDLNDVVKDLTNLMNPVVKNKGIEFKINIENDLPKIIESDRLRLDQVLRNLLSNAIKFTNVGSVQLNIKQDESNQDLIVFSVKDTGIGIAEDKQKIIFEAFQQADGSTQRKFGGTGLGLSISREIAKLLGGKLTLKSTVGEGSEFSLIIPKDEKSKKNINKKDALFQDDAPAEISAVTGLMDYNAFGFSSSIKDLQIPEDVEDDRNNIYADDKVILIVEDDTHFAKALLKYARLQNYKGIVEVRGDRAISAAVQYHPAAILLDVQLPVKNGWQVMDELKSNPETRPIPVHIMSSLHVRQESLMKGAIDFINKPVAVEQMTEIFKKIEEAMKKSPQKVLIVEENAKHANALSYFLKSFNISLSVQDNVEDSVAALTSGKVDCVILDVGAARGRGYQIIESIKAYEGMENLPIIIFTENNLSKAEELKIRQYADSIVVKTAHSYQRILDEVGLFLHLVEEKNSSPETIRNRTLGSLTEVLKGKKILVTDDDVRNIFSLTKALEKYQAEVILAMDGRQALEQIKENPDIDVVLMDMMMPEMDGYETIQEIRKMPEYKKLPIIAVTAKSMIGDRDKCLQAGASDYITKPVDIDQLLSLLRVWLYEN